MRYKEQMIRIQVKVIFEYFTPLSAMKAVAGWLLSGCRVIHF